MTDDTAAFGRALAALKAAGSGILVVPAGTYLRTYLPHPGTLSLGSNMAIVGDHAVLKANTVGFEMLAIGGSNITVAGVTINGARQSDGTALATRGISVYQGSSDVSILDTTVQGIGQAPADTSGPNAGLVTAIPVGIMMYGNVDRVTVDGSTIRDIRAVHKDPGDNSWIARGILIMAGNDASGNPLPNVATNVTIQNSSFSAIGPKDGDDAIVIQPSDNTLVTAPYGISLSAAAQASNPTIAGNTFTNVNTALVVYG